MKQSADADVCLVSMPYASLSRPSMALGLLKAILEEGGMRAAVVHANLLFAEAIGLRRYEAIEPAQSRGERTQRARGRSAADALISDLWALRAAATQFVDDVARRVLA